MEKRTTQWTLNRLRDIRNRFSQVPEKEFRYDSWKVDSDCGTACCIGGWCAMWYGDEGLSFIASRITPISSLVRYVSLEVSSIDSLNSWSSIDSLNAWLGLTFDESLFLFLGYGYIFPFSKKEIPSAGVEFGSFKNVTKAAALGRIDLMIEEYELKLQSEERKDVTKELISSMVITEERSDLKNIVKKAIVTSIISLFSILSFSQDTVIVKHNGYPYTVVRKKTKTKSGMDSVKVLRGSKKEGYMWVWSPCIAASKSATNTEIVRKAVEGEETKRKEKHNIQ